MLILTRRRGETIRIGDDIEVVIVAVNHSQVRVGIKAPKDVVVLREEVALRQEPDTAAAAP